MLHVLARDKTQPGRVYRVTLSGWRSGIGDQMAEVGIAAFRAQLDAMHVVRIIVLFDDRIFRDRFAESGTASPAVEFVERTKKRFAGNDVDVNTEAHIIPILVLECGLGPVLAGKTKVSRLQERTQSRGARQRATGN